MDARRANPLCWRNVARVLALGLLTLGIVVAPAPAVAAGCWWPPVSAPILRPFEAPTCAWCAGHRGLEYATDAGVAVRAVATGRVSFSGTVVGTRYVVVRHADGRRVTYGRVDSDLAVGQVVVAGSLVGVTTGRLYFGLRSGERYLDPAPYIGHPVYRVRLIPVDGSPGRDAGAPRLGCHPGHVNPR